MTAAELTQIVKIESDSVKFGGVWLVLNTPAGWPLTFIGFDPTLRPIDPIQSIIESYFDSGSETSAFWRDLYLICYGPAFRTIQLSRIPI